MSLEIEKSFNLNEPLLNNNPEYPSKAKIIKLLKKFGAKKQGIYLFRIMKFIPPINDKNASLRIRDEGFRVTITYKEKDPKSKFKKEYEIVIDDFDNGVEILKKLGAKEMYYYEKIREIWNYKNCEIIFDEQPALPTLMEIEYKGTYKEKGEKSVNNIAKKLGFNKDHIAKHSSELYKELYGITFKDVSISYMKMSNIFKKYCKKNKIGMMKIIQNQLKIYKKIIKII